MAWLATAPTVLAHEGAGHSMVMGTVRSIGAHEIVVRTTDGKQRTIALEGDTECVSRQGKAACADIEVGDRVVVTTRTRKDGKVGADEVRFSRRGYPDRSHADQ